jgi:ferredoxin
MRIVVDWDLCEANAVCVKLAPKIFRINEKDQLDLLVEQPSDSERALVENAVRMCPRGALSIEGG